MNIEKTWIWGGAGAVVGLLLGIAIAGDGREARYAAERGQRQMEENLAAMSATVGKMDQSLADLGGRVAGIEASLKSVSEQGSGVQALSQRLDQVGVELQGAVQELGGAMSDVGTSVTKSLAERMDGLRTALAGIGGRSGEPAAEAASAAAPEAGAAPAAAAAPGAGELVAMGSTVVFADGAVRVFLSGVDAEAGTARVAVNGPVAATVSLNAPEPVGDCTVTLTGFAENGATFDVGCGDAAAAAAPAGDATQASGEPAGSGKPVAIGAAETLVDGKLRVFLSAVDAEAGTARVAVNGPQAISVSLGVPVEAAGCQVTLTGIGDGEATIDGSC